MNTEHFIDFYETPKNVCVEPFASSFYAEL